MCCLCSRCKFMIQGNHWSEVRTCHWQAMGSVAEQIWIPPHQDSSKLVLLFFVLVCSYNKSTWCKVCVAVLLQWNFQGMAILQKLPMCRSLATLRIWLWESRFCRTWRRIHWQAGGFKLFGGWWGVIRWVFKTSAGTHPCTEVIFIIYWMSRHTHIRHTWNLLFRYSTSTHLL